MALLMAVMIPACGKDNEPESDPNHDAALIGTWGTTLKLQTYQLDVKLTFAADGKFSGSAMGTVPTVESPVDIDLTGTWETASGVIKLDLDQSDLPEFLPLNDNIKYEIILDQLYLEGLPLFPLDRLD